MPWLPARLLENNLLDTPSDHVNTLRVNIIKPLYERILPLLEERFPQYFHRRQVIRRKLEIQLEFPWLAKK